MNGALTCHNADCRLTFATLVNDTLVIQSRHNHERHTNVLTVEQLEALLALMRANRVHLLAA